MVYSSGGEKTWPGTVKTSSYNLEPSTPDEFINYPDPITSIRSEDHSLLHKGLASTALYDRHPSDKAVDNTRETENGSSHKHKGGHSVPPI